MELINNWIMVIILSIVFEVENLMWFVILYNRMIVLMRWRYYLYMFRVFFSILWCEFEGFVKLLMSFWIFFLGVEVVSDWSRLSRDGSRYIVLIIWVIGMFCMLKSLIVCGRIFSMKSVSLVRVLFCVDCGFFFVLWE